MRMIIAESENMEINRHGGKYANYTIYYLGGKKLELWFNEHNGNRYGGKYSTVYEGKSMSELYEHIDKSIPQAYDTLVSQVDELISCYGDTPTHAKSLYKCMAETPYYKTEDPEIVVNYDLSVDSSGWDLYFRKNYQVDVDGWTIHHATTLKEMMAWIEDNIDDDYNAYDELNGQLRRIYNVLTS